MDFVREMRLMNEFKFYSGPYGKGISFECGDGWYDLLYDLSKGIQNLIDTGVEDPQFVVYQVKEKYATLRFYTNFSCEETDKLIDAAVDKSAITCEMCGEPGELRISGGWQSTLCEMCHQKDLIRSQELFKTIKDHIVSKEKKEAKNAGN